MTAADAGQRSIFRNLSPLDHRYYLANRLHFDALSDILSEEATVRYKARVEVALLQALAETRTGGPLKAETVATLSRLSHEIRPEDVAAEEEKTRHDTRALVNVLQRMVPPELRSMVHLGATSFDIVDTASALRFRDATRKVVLPLVVVVARGLAQLAEREAATPQVGRTHGQHAVPLTFGFAMAGPLCRLTDCAQRLYELSGDLRGKLSGSVGAYNATSLVVADPIALEQRFLALLDLKPGDHATQIVAPEPLLRLLLELNIAFGIVAGLADDLRHLQRSEINEVREEFASKDQVGSSTMPQKRNPWNCEHVKSLWKAFSPRVMTFYLDQMSEHQRDLTNSASARFVAEFFAGCTAAFSRMASVLAGLSVNRERMRGILTDAGDTTLAEAAYVALAAAGKADAHELVRRATVRCESAGTTVAQELQRDPRVWQLIEDSVRSSTGGPAEELFRDPARYLGRATQRAAELASASLARLDLLGRSLEGE